MIFTHYSNLNGSIHSHVGLVKGLLIFKPMERARRENFSKKVT